MKKIAFRILLLSLLAVMLASSVVSAAEGFLESPNIKIIVDGKLTTYSEVPIIVKDRTLLPLRSILADLGVQNDDEHIQWNGEEESVTVVKDDTRIYLKVNSGTAFVNDEPAALDAPPVNYKGRIYIPARFISQSLNKKVVWDGATSTVYIRDEKDFDSIKDILEKTQKAMDTVNKARFRLSMNSELRNGNIKVGIGANGTGIQDRQKKNTYLWMELDMQDKKPVVEYIFTDEDQFVRKQPSGPWERVRLQNTGTGGYFADNDFINIISTEDTACAGLTVEYPAMGGEVLLKGNVYLEKLFTRAMSGQSSVKSFKAGSYYLELLLDSDTNLVKNVKMKVGGVVEMEGIKPQMDTSIEINYDEYGGSYEVPVPEEAAAGTEDAGV